MGTITRSGYLIDHNQEVKKELTVRPQVNNEFGFPPPPFKVFKTTKEKLPLLTKLPNKPGDEDNIGGFYKLWNQFSKFWTKESTPPIRQT